MSATQSPPSADRSPGTVGWRARFGVIIPSTNTAVERDYNLIRPDGVTFHTARMWIQPTVASDKEAEEALQQLRAAIDTAIRDVLTCFPDHLIAGMSSETFMGGLEGNTQFVKRAEESSGLSVTSGASAVKAALDLYGAKRIAVLTPYQQVIDTQVERYFDDLGYDLVRMIGLRVEKSTGAAGISHDRLREVLRELDGPDVDAIVQAGTNLSVTLIAEEMERELGKPIIPINVACVWHAFRAAGIDDRIAGFGSLLETY
jgi:maleate isomerase